MEYPDFMKDFSSIGQWETFGWGARWELTDAEMERAIAKMDVQRNLLGAIGAGLTVAAGSLTGGPGAVPAGAAVAGLVAFYEVFKSRMKSVNEGNGVIVEFPFDYSKSQSKWREYVRLYLPLGRLSGAGHWFDPIRLNVSNIKPRPINEKADSSSYTKKA